MAQIMYNRPWPRWLVFAVCIPFFIATIVVAAIYGVKWPYVWIVLAIWLLSLTILTVFDPDTTIESNGALPDGSPVRVRRPLIGFKKLECIVGVTGGYEMRYDGFRYEQAYVRI